MDKKELIKNKRRNARLYPIYKMFSWDLLFYYAISFVFLVEVKGFSAAQVMLTDALYPILKIILNISHPEISDTHIPITTFNNGFSISLFLY